MNVDPRITDHLIPRLKAMGVSEVVAHGTPSRPMCNLAIRLSDYIKQAPEVISVMRDFKHSHLDVMFTYDLLDAAEPLPKPRVVVNLL